MSRPATAPRTRPRRRSALATSSLRWVGRSWRTPSRDDRSSRAMTAHGSTAGGSIFASFAYARWRCGRVAIERGDPAGAATDAEIVLDLDPYRESAYALLMRAYVADGNPALAMEAYEQLRTRLEEDLGASPSAETEAVFLDLLRAQGR